MTGSLRALLTGLIDYAGLFPPASVPMVEAVRNYAEYRRGEHAWMLGRFIVPVGRLAEFGEAGAELGQVAQWPLSVLASSAEDLQRLRELNANSGTLAIDAVELKTASAAEIRAARASVGPSVALYFETPLADMPDLLPTMAEAEAYAKLRTGGITSEQIPNTTDVFDFLQSTIATGVPFKATAGLHHLLRSEQPLTYDAGVPRVTVHGFVNLFVAATVLYNRINDDDALAILNETDPAAFVFEDDEMRWRDRVTLATERIAEARRIALSFGSCSFVEPVADLRELGWL